MAMDPNRDNKITFNYVIIYKYISNYIFKVDTYNITLLLFIFILE